MTAFPAAIPILNVRFVLLVIAALVTPAAPTWGASASAGSGVNAVRNDSDSGAANWRFSNPTARDSITWTAGANMTDGTLHPQTVEGIEFKFQIPPNPGADFTGRIFNGFSDVDGGPAPARSEAITSGRGLSQGIAGALFGTNALARWTVTATGKLGGGTGASWSSQAAGNDPFALTAVDFEEIVEPFYDLFFEVGLTAATISPLGSVALQAAYESSVGSRDVLRIALGPDGVTVSGAPANLEIYLLEDFAEGPTEEAGDLIDPLGLEALLGADFLPDLMLDQAVHLGLLLQGLPTPAADLGDGALARVHVDLTVTDAAVRLVSSPGSLVLALSALLLLQRQRRPTGSARPG